MGKSSKKTKETAPVEKAVAAPVVEPQTGNGTSKSATPNVTKAPRTPKALTKKSGVKPRGSTLRKGSSTRQPRSAGGAKKSAATAGAISDDHIRIRAYFISLERIREGRPGSSDEDWLEARRQLEKQEVRLG